MDFLIFKLGGLKTLKKIIKMNFQKGKKSSSTVPLPTADANLQNDTE